MEGYRRELGQRTHRVTGVLSPTPLTRESSGTGRHQTGDDGKVRTGYSERGSKYNEECDLKKVKDLVRSEKGQMTVSQFRGAGRDFDRESFTSYL